MGASDHGGLGDSSFQLSPLPGISNAKDNGVGWEACCEICSAASCSLSTVK